MKDFIAYGPTPTGEGCAQVGQDDYFQQSQYETKAFIGQMRRLFGAVLEAAGVRLVVKGFPHDFGTYHEVCAIFDDEDPEQNDVAFSLEDKIPENWDEIARNELASQGYRHLYAE
jgi:hypothetical protein